MLEQCDFRQLIRLVRSGDNDAAAELVRRYGPAIQSVVHVRLRDSRLRRLFDSLDICQSVMASFFIRAAVGQYEIDTPEQLLRLLGTMARNKVSNAAKHEQAQCRDYRRAAPGDGVDSQLAGADATPSRQLACEELLDRLRQQLDAEERLVFELRLEGREWAEIASQLGSTPEALRKRHARALSRVAGELGLDEVVRD